MNTPEILTFRKRLRNAIRAFRGSNVGSINFGVDIRRCWECEYRNDSFIRDNLLVTVGLRAGFMDGNGWIDIPPGLDAENELANYVAEIVDEYMHSHQPESFDEFIERKLLIKYGKETKCQ